VVVKVEEKSTKALLDTGSCISSISKQFYEDHLSHLELKSLDNLLKIQCADGNNLPYLGYIEARLYTDDGVPDSKAQDCLFLITPDTSYSGTTPVLIGTNILNEVIQDCHKTHGQQYLQRCKLKTPWYLAFRCIAIREKELKKNSDRLGLIRCAEVSKITLGPNETKYIHGYIDKELEYHSTCAIIQETESSTLPDYIDIASGVIHYNYKKNDKVTVNISNLTTNTVTISPKAIIAEIQPVDVDQTVLDDLNDDQPPEDETFSKIHIEEELNAEKKEMLMELLNKHKDIFSKGDTDIGHCDKIKHRIDLTDDVPFKVPYRRIPPSMIDEVRKHLEQLLSSGIIEKSKSPFASAVVLVRKKNGSLRLCVDYRLLNRKTIKDAYALPRIEEIFDILHGARYFSTLDMKAGYHQVPIEESHKERTAFTVGPLGFWQYRSMPFGLCNSPATYQRLMEECLGDLNMTICIIYLDDVIIFANTFEEHLERLDRVLTRLKENNLKLSAEKCYFLKKKAKFLGHVVSENGVETDPDKTQKVKDWPTPKNADELRSFVAFAGYYRRFLKNFSKIVKPLNDLLPPTTTKKNKLTKQSKEWVWGDEQQKVFDNIKEMLISPPILAYPDFSKAFELHTDASGKGLGSVLYQKDGKHKRVIAYASRGLSKSERNYSAFKLEFLALKWAVTEKFSDYLMGTHFIVYTDNNPLTHVLTTAKLDATGHRWVAALGEYDFDIIYRPGSSNADADGLSRYMLVDDDIQGTNAKEMAIMDSSSIKAICKIIHCNPLVDVLPASEINIVDVTDTPDQPMAQIEMTELRRAQRNDPLIETWRIATIDKRLPRKELHSKENLTMKKNFKNFKMIRGLLYREIETEGQKTKQLVLPNQYRQEALQGLHNDIGHPGRDRTLSLLRERFFWPGMTNDVEQWIKSCNRCLRRKTPTNSRAPLINIETSYPLQLVCMDYLTLEPSKGGICNILVITDHYTKFAMAIPTKNQTAKTTAEALYDNFIIHYGIPTKLHSDQGANFQSETIKELCNLTGIRKSRTTPYHAMGNGITERFNRTLLGMLGTLDPDQKRDWKKYVAPLVYAYNCTRHESTKFSPFELLFGRKPKLPIDARFAVTEIDDQTKSTDNYITSLRERLKETQELVHKMTDKARTKQKTGYDKKARASRICVGDKVLVKILAFDGKHKIADKFENNIYEVVAQPNTEIPVFEVRSPDGIQKKLHRNHLHPLVSEEPDANEVTDETRPRPVPRPRNLAGKAGKDSEKTETSDVTDREESDEDVADTVYPVGDAHISDVVDVVAEPEIIEVVAEPDIIEEVAEPETIDEEDILIEDEPEVIDDEPEEDDVEAEGPTDVNSVDRTEDTRSNEDLDARAPSPEPEDDEHTTEVKSLENVDNISEPGDVREETTETEDDTDDPENTEVKSIDDVAGAAHAQGKSSEDDPPRLRRSTRDKKKPKYLDSYHTYSTFVRPIDIKVNRMMSLINSGVLESVDSELGDKLLKSIVDR